MHSLRLSLQKIAVVFALVTLLPLVASAQALESTAAPEDVESIESIIAATYESIARAPGGQFDWDRFRSLFIPNALLIPNTEQSGGEFRVVSPQGFVDWIEGVTTIGGADDKGFAEEGYHNKVDRYGDVANVMSSYQKHLWGETEIIGRGINSFQLVWHQERWWITGIAWDETYAAGPIPEEYGGQ